MATAATIKKNIAKLEAALKSKATPKSLKSKLEVQLVKSKAELSGINKGTKPKTSTTKSTQTSLEKLKDMVKKNKKLKTYKGAGVDLEKDADRPALPIGRRTAKQSGKTYYEYRANRIDVKQPPKRYPKLEKGGYMAKGGVVGEYKVVPNKRGEGKLRMYVTSDYEMAFKISGSKEEAEKAAQKFVKEHNETHPTATVTKIHPSGQAIKNKNVSYVTKDEIAKFEDGGYMADGGETGNLEIIDFYVNEYPKDDIVFEINPKATFNGLYEVLNKKGDAYKYIGVADSLVRERVFQKLAEIKGVKYDVIYDMWMDSDYAKGGYMAKGGYFAKGGLTEHGLKVGDTIVDDMFWDKSVKVLNSKTGYAVVKIETGERKEMKAMGGEMHRTQE